MFERTFFAYVNVDNKHIEIESFFTYYAVISIMLLFAAAVDYFLSYRFDFTLLSIVFISIYLLNRMYPKLYSKGYRLVGTVRASSYKEAKDSVKRTYNI